MEPSAKNAVDEWVAVDLQRGRAVLLERREDHVEILVERGVDRRNRRGLLLEPVHPLLGRQYRDGLAIVVERDARLRTAVVLRGDRVGRQVLKLVVLDRDGVARLDVLEQLLVEEGAAGTALVATDSPDVSLFSLLRSNSNSFAD